MNKVIEQLQNRRSVRNFTGEKVKDEDLELILRTAQRAPSSVNGQQISLIVTRDKEKLKKIAEICGGQGHIANSDVFITILIDYHSMLRNLLIDRMLLRTLLMEYWLEQLMQG